MSRVGSCASRQGVQRLPVCRGPSFRIRCQRLTAPLPAQKLLTAPGFQVRFRLLVPPRRAPGTGREKMENGKQSPGRSPGGSWALVQQAGVDRQVAGHHGANGKALLHQFPAPPAQAGAERSPSPSKGGAGHSHSAIGVREARDFLGLFSLVNHFSCYLRQW